MLVLIWAGTSWRTVASHHYFMTGLLIVEIVSFLSGVGRIDFVPQYFMQTSDYRLIQGNQQSSWEQVSHAVYYLRQTCEACITQDMNFARWTTRIIGWSADEFLPSIGDMAVWANSCPSCILRCQRIIECYHLNRHCGCTAVIPFQEAVECVWRSPLLSTHDERFSGLAGLSLPYCDLNCTQLCGQLHTWTYSHWYVIFCISTKCDEYQSYVSLNTRCQNSEVFYAFPTFLYNSKLWLANLG